MIYTFAAYAIVWTLLLGYVLYLARKQRKVEKRLEALEK